jgi:hypothetical protein
VRPDEITEQLCRAAGWRRPEPEADGRQVFRLEGGLAWELVAPDERTVIFLADLGPWPEERPGDVCRRAAAMAAASFRHRRSVLSVKDGRFRLHQAVNLGFRRADEVPGRCADFLNDFAWWRKNWPEN